MAVNLEAGAFYWLLFAFILGLAVGSFLNVVIYRLPIILERNWKKEAHEVLGLKEEVPHARFNLAYPASHCPQCGIKIAFYQNIPVVSYLLQQGRCNHCGVKISPYYPLVELITGLLFAYAELILGPSWAFIAAAILIALLLCLLVIDLKTSLLPDILTYSLLWSGLLANLARLYKVSLSSAVLGAFVGYTLLWLVFQGFRLLTRKEGMGYGDFKLMAALGAWLGIEYLPLLILFSACLGLFFALCMHVKKGESFPFGPAMALSGLILFFLSLTSPSWLKMYVFG